MSLLAFSFSHNFLSSIQPLTSLSVFFWKTSQSGQQSTNDVAKRDLRAELLLAEQEAREKKRKAEGGGPSSGTGTSLTIESNSDKTSIPNDEANKRRKLLQEALEMDKDDDDDDDDDEDGEGEGEKENREDDKNEKEGEDGR